MKLLLHACCGPCSLEPVRVLRSKGLEPAIYYANSNIAPASEYEHRLATLQDWAQSENVCVIEGDFRPNQWEEAVGVIGDAVREKFGLVADEHAAAFAQLHAADTGSMPVCLSDGGDRTQLHAAATGSAQACSNDPSALSEGSFAESPVGNLDPEARAARRERCRACYRLRFDEAARYAAACGFDALGTTLSVSPYQYTDVIEEELRRACENAGLTCAFADYRPLYDEATRKSRALGMYRQNFCGCRFSAEEAAAERKARKAARKAAKAAKKTAAAIAQAHAAQAQTRENGQLDGSDQEEAARRASKAEKEAYAAKQAKKRAILKALREQQR